jgi:hypothetical protein
MQEVRQCLTQELSPRILSKLSEFRDPFRADRKISPFFAFFCRLRARTLLPWAACGMNSVRPLETRSAVENAGRDIRTGPGSTVKSEWSDMVVMTSENVASYPA